MTIHTTRWAPDTCSCVIEYTWDDAQSEATRTHTVSNFINRCAAHTILATDNTRFTTLMDENPKKNGALQVALDNGPTTLYDVQPDTSRILKPTITYNYSWSGTAPNRVLTISFTGITLTTTQKTTIRNALNTKYGTGKVLLP